METGLRFIKCPGSTVQRCSQEIRLKNVTEQHYGKTFDVTCPKCGLVFRTVIHAPGNSGEHTPNPDVKDDFVEDPLGIMDALFGKLGVKKRNK